MFMLAPKGSCFTDCSSSCASLPSLTLLLAVPDEPVAEAIVPSAADFLDSEVFALAIHFLFQFSELFGDKLLCPFTVTRHF